MSTDAQAQRVLTAFAEAGGQVVDLPMLQPAEALLDLYGEDIRARAYTTRDPLAGELMLRPDFTVPVVQMHLQSGADAAQYAYSGKVFRVQELHTSRPSEYHQVGYERLGDKDAALADAEVFALFTGVLSGLPLRVSTGDIGVLSAAVQALTTSDVRRAALMRHIWRPGRFKRLLDRFSGAIAAREVIVGDTPHVGLRSATEVQARLDRLAADANETPLSGEQVAILGEILAMRLSASAALARLRVLTQPMPGLSAAVDRLAARLDALNAKGVDVDALDWEGSYGRTNMEYYDGFVFGFYAATGPETPPVATGGRYDALTRALGGTVIPAVGGMIRPGLIEELRA